MASLVSIPCTTDGTIATFDIAGDVLVPRRTSPIGEGVGVLALVATGERGWSRLKNPFRVVSLRLDRAAATWRVVGERPADDSLTYLSLSGDGRFLLGVSYEGGFGCVWPVDGDRLGEPTARVSFRNPHSIIERDGLVHLASLGEDLVATFRLTADGELVPLGTTAAPTGSGPRHLVLDETGENLYVTTEFAGLVLQLRRDRGTGRLTPVGQTPAYAPDRGLRHSRFGADPRGEHLIWSADLHLAPGVLLASERCESTLSVLPRHPDGSLAEQVCVVGVETQPRGFAVAPDGRHVVVVGERDSHVGLYRLDDDGQLVRVDQQPNGAGAAWVSITA